MKKNNLLLLTPIVIFIMTLGACSLFLSSPDEQKETITSLKLSKSTVQLGVGGIEQITLSMNPTNLQRNATVTYQVADSSIVSADGDAYGVTIIGKKSGNTTVRALCDGITSTCVVSVVGTDPTLENSPQISSSTIALELEKGTSKRVQMSLTGGTSTDMSSFSWSIDKSSIATVEGSGQTAYITAKENGIAQITVTHPLATYPYRFCVFVKPDTQKAVYITTGQNILTLNRAAGEKSISVNLMNGDSSASSFFTWEILSSEESDNSCISIESNGQNCIITPLKQGTAFIRVSHPLASYPLDIRVRIITIIENVYIEPSLTKVTLDGLIPQTITADILGSEKSTFDNTEFVWSVEDDSIIELSPFQESCGLIGLKNGSTKVIVSHPAAKYPREILVFVTNHPNGSINGSMFITTTQNYIRTKVGTNDIELSVQLVGGELGDEKDFNWSINDTSVISATTTNGIVSSRAILSSRTNGTLYIDALKEGTAVITITHPKIVIPTEVMVKVYPTSALLEEPFYIQTQSIIMLLTGATQSINANLYGTNKIASDESNILWTSGNTDVLTVLGNGCDAIITANAPGESYIEVSHPNVEFPKKIVTVIANTQEELAAYKIMYSDKSSYNVVAGTTQTLYLNTRNIIDEELSNITWSSQNSNIASVQIGDTNTSAIVTGVAAGTTKIVANHPNVLNPVEFEVTVLPVGTDIGVIPSPIYLTTSQNVVQFTEINTNKKVSVSPVRLPVDEYRNITWSVEDETICSVSGTGSSVTVTALKEGVTKILVTHVESENILPITIRVGNEYVIQQPTIPYINPSQEVLGLVNGGQGQEIKAAIKNSTVTTGFTWEIDDSSIATISPLDASCYVVPKSPGQALITITHEGLNLTKKVLVLVGNSEEELASLAFITTAQNVVSLKTGDQQNVTVRIANASNSINTYTWKIVENPANIQVISSGATAVIKGLNPGVSTIEVSNTDCKYPLTIRVQVVDSVADAVNYPFITTGQNIITLTSTGTKTINVTLAGGTDEDNSDFNWSIDRSDLITIVGNRNTAVIKGREPGECLITVSHPKARYNFPIKVIIEEPTTGNSLYIKTSPANIITMKPADSEMTVTATLVGGTAEDAYGFKWYADNYNCIDLTATANTAIITPRAEGTAIITITHPKAGFNGELQVRVTEYSTFEFAQTNMTIMEGDTQFISMRVPAMETEYGGKVIYSTDNEKIVSITGTNKVAQLTAVGSGTATVSAVSPSGAKSQMMVYVKKAATATTPYITSGTNVISMKITDNQRTVSATLVGQDVIATDQYNLQWEIEDPSIAKLVGTSGSSILIQPVGAGETTLKVSHTKTDTIYTIHIQVIGTAGGMSLNKSYVSLETGKTIEISASIDNGTATDYNNITWSIDKVNGSEICTVMGSGKTVALYGISAGRTTLSAEYNGNISTCDVIINAARQFSFDTQTMRVQPGETKKFKYTLVPDDAEISWYTTTNDYMSYSVDTASKTVSITGIAEAPSGVTLTTLSAISNGMKASISITTSWDYNFNVDKIKLQGTPDKVYSVNYSVCPTNAELLIDDCNIANIEWINNGDGTGVINFTPTKEGKDTVIIQAKNPATGKIFASKSVTLDFKYDKITLTPTIIRKDGKFSRYETGILYLGDGEELEIRLDCAESNASVTISSVEFININATNIPKLTDSDFSSDIKVLKHPKDEKEIGYVIPEWLDVYDQNGSFLDPFYPQSFWAYTSDSYWDGGWWDCEYEYCRCYLTRAGQCWADNSKYDLQPGGGVKKGDATKLQSLTHKRNQTRDGEWVPRDKIWNSYWHRPIIECSGHQNDSAGYNKSSEEWYINVIEQATSDESITRIEQGKLNCIIIHNDKLENVSIPIYIEYRNCTKNSNN